MKEGKVIALRRPPGDNYELVDGNEEIYPSLTDTLEAYFQKTQYKGDFIVSPSEGVIRLVGKEEIIMPEPPKKYSLYGEVKQGI